MTYHYNEFEGEIDYGYRKLKDYNGYEILKTVHYYDGKVDKTYYEVNDDDGVMINVFNSLKEAKKFIDTVLVA